MEGPSSADPMDITEKKRIQNRMAQQKYRKRLKERIRELEELKKHIGDFSELKDHVDAAYSPPSTNIQTGAYATESTSIGLLPDQEISAPESDNCLWALNCPLISPAQLDNHPGVSPSSSLDFLSSTFEHLDYSSSSLSSEPQPHVSSCAHVARQWPCALSASSPRVSSSSAPHQVTRDTQSVSPEDRPSPGASCEERFIHILDSIHQAGYESIEKSKFAAFSNLGRASDVDDPLRRRPSQCSSTDERLLVMIEYYTASFKADSVAHWSQKLSRRYRLCGMLEDIYDNSQAWPEDERMVFHKALACIAVRERTAKTQCTHMLSTTF